MAMTKFTAGEIRDGLLKITKDAVTSCHRKFRSHSKASKQGLEKIFDDAFYNAIEVGEWQASRQVNRNSFGFKDKFRPKGRVDMVVTHEDGFRVGIEFKVCQFPRMKWTSPNDSTYDVGQIASDFGALRTYAVESGYCMVVLHGGLVDMPSVTELGIARSFHNAMFADYMAAKHWGYLKYAKQYAKDKHQMQLIEDMGFGKPYFSEKANPRSFCKLFKKERLAVVGLSIK